MSGQAAQDDGAWIDSVLQDIAQSSCDHSNLKIQLKRIKHFAKRGDSQVEVVFTAVWEALRSQNAMMRLAAMHVCDELFVRSRHFRRLLLDNKFPIFVEQVVAPGKSLPAPKEAAKQLREKALDSIQLWTQRFGQHHVELTMAYTYLRDLGMIQGEGNSQGGSEATLAGAPGAHQPSGPAQAVPDEHLRVQQLVSEIPGSAAIARACIQCVATLLRTFGHDVPERLTKPPEPPHAAQTDAARHLAAAPTREARSPRGEPPDGGRADGTALEPASEEEFEFEDVDWEAQAAAADPVAHTMAAAARSDAEALPKRRGLHREVRVALLAALRKGRKAMQATHLPEVRRLRDAVAESGVCERAIADAAASGDAAAAVLPRSWRGVPLQGLRAAAELPGLAADSRDLLALLAAVPELAEEPDPPVEAAAVSGRPRERVLRGRNERDWPDVEVPQAVCIRDPAAANPDDPYTITPARSRAAPPHAAATPQQAPVGPAAPPESSSCAAPYGAAQDRSAAAGARKSTLSKEAIQRLAAKAPVLPAGDYLKLWDSYEEQMEHVKRHMTQGQMHSHWGRVDDDVQLEPAQVEALLAQRAVFHDAIAEALPPRPRVGAEGGGAAERKAAAVAAGDVGAEGGGGGCGEAVPETAAEFRAAARAHNMSVLAEAGARELGTIDGGAVEGGKGGKKRGRGAGGRKKLRNVMQKLARGARG